MEACLRNRTNNLPCSTLPVPERSRLPIIARGTFLLTPLRNGVWAYEDGVYNSLIIVQGAHLVMIDMPDSPNSNTATGSGTLLTDAAQKALNGTIPRRIDLVYTHAHFDHIGAATRFNAFVRETYPRARVQILGTEESRELINRSTSGRAVNPTIIVRKSGRTLRVGRLDIQLTPVGGHTQQDLLVYIPPLKNDEGIVVLVDVVFPRWSPFINLALTQDVQMYVDAHKRILQLDFGTYLGGHVLIGGRQEVEDSLEFVMDLIEAARIGTASVTPERLAEAGFGRLSDPSAVEFGNIWFGFVTVFRSLEVERCATIMLEKWACRLAGLDIIIDSHCVTAIEFNLLES